MKNVIQSLWIGSRLSRLEQLCIASFLHHGHEFDLYTYGAVEGVPSGTKVCDAGKILPSSRIFQYRKGGSYAGFSNFFRYRLLLERGGWWVDTDVVCLDHFAIEDVHVFATEALDGKEVLSSGIIRAPQDSDAIRYAWERCENLDPRELRWGQTGSVLLTETVQEFGLQNRVMPPRCFCPVPYKRWEDALDPVVVWNFGPDTRAVHLWNEMWRRAGRDKDGDYAPDCLFEHLKRKYKVGQGSISSQVCR